MRERDPEDGRGKIVRFTERGHAAWAAHLAASTAIEAEWAARFDEEEWAVFRDVLERLALAEDPSQVGPPGALVLDA